MRDNYKILDTESFYFISSTIVEWITVFVNTKYLSLLAETINFYIKNNGLEIYYYVILDNHFHMIAKHPDLNGIIRSIKGYSAKIIIKYLVEDQMNWKLDLFKRFKKDYKNTTYQIWQEGYHPQIINSQEMLNQKIEYIHYNPVKRGLVNSEEHWKYSSANNMNWDGTKIINLREYEI